MVKHAYTIPCSRTLKPSAGVRTSTSASASTTNGTARLAVFLVVILSLVEVNSGQNIHFSNGWYPGKKRSSGLAVADAAASLAEASSPLAAASPGAAVPPSGARFSPSGARFLSSCMARPEVGEFINTLVMEELFRQPSSCVYSVSRGLRDMLESTARKLDKW